MKNLEELTAEDVLRELVADVEAVLGTQYMPYTERDFAKAFNGRTDLHDTYYNAKHVLDKRQRMGHGAKNPLKIKRWIKSGELTGAEDVSDVLEQVGNILDHGCVWDNIGDVIFEAADGVTYVVTIEGMISQADPDYVKEILAQDAERISGDFDLSDGGVIEGPSREDPAIRRRDKDGNVQEVRYPGEVNYQEWADLFGFSPPGATP
jgi:hypothetical protein